MHRLVVCIAALSLSSPAMAGWCGYETPPPEYRNEPSVAYKIFDQPSEMLDETCHTDGGPPGFIGACAEEVVSAQEQPPGFWIIYIRNDVSAEDRECILLHEKAHLPPNNWEHGGDWQQRDYPIWRRPTHVDPFYYARGRSTATPLSAID